MEGHGSKTPNCQTASLRQRPGSWNSRSRAILVLHTAGLGRVQPSCIVAVASAGKRALEPRAQQDMVEQRIHSTAGWAQLEVAGIQRPEPRGSEMSRHQHECLELEMFRAVAGPVVLQAKDRSLEIA